MLVNSLVVVGLPFLLAILCCLRGFVVGGGGGSGFFFFLCVCVVVVFYAQSQRDSTGSPEEIAMDNPHVL